MNYKVLSYYIGRILCLEALLLLPPLGISLYMGEESVVRAIAITMAALLIPGLIAGLHKPAKPQMYAREGFVIVALCWIVMSLFGALPFFLSGAIPNYMRAVFETVSGFTTTGASILADVEALPRGLLFWRSFTQWIGGMGVLVLMLAFMPKAQGSGNSIHIMRAESPGPQVGKLVPKTARTAVWLYVIYCAMSAVMLIFLAAGDMPLMDAFCVTFSTAGTGGFAVRNAGCADYSDYSRNVMTVFMALFGVNFSIYFLLIAREFKKILRNEELRLYLGMLAGAITLITVNLLSSFSSVGAALHHAAFQASSIMTTSSFTSVDFTQWPALSKAVLVILMLTGACAGSTAGGIKIARILILLKFARHGLGQIFSPRAVKVIRLNDEPLEEGTIRAVHVYMVMYALIVLLSLLLISVDNFSLETNIFAAISTLNNVGGGFGAIGPSGDYAMYSGTSLFVLTLNMLIGRLEIFPMLILLRPSIWKRANITRM